MNSYCNPEIPYDVAENADLEATYYGAFKKYGMPYLDHCYATGLPMAQFDSHPDTPPLPLTEPLAAFVDIEEVGLRGGSHGGVNMPPSINVGKRTGGNSAKNSAGHNNSSSTNTVISNNGGGDTEVDPYEGSVTRCICDFQHDDGYMICCDRCGVWQHVECMGVDGKHIPDSYLCELCYPRLVDKRRAVRIQSKKKEELEMEESSGSADDSLEEESRRPRRKGGRRRDQARRRTTERSDSGGGQRKSQQRRKRTSSEMEGKKNSDSGFNFSKEQKRLRPQSFTGYGVERSDMWDLNPPLEMDARFGTGATGAATFQPNTYSAEVLNLLAIKVKAAGASNNSNVMAITQQLSRKCFKVVSYEDGSRGLEAIEMIKPNHTVAEYTGKTVMRRDYERNQIDLSYPFAVCYMGINGVELCVDSNDFNNEAKFVRRSCTPNAKVVHLLEKTGLRFFVCATKTIPPGKEITIPFYFDYQRSTVELRCPCGKFNCMVAKHFKRMTGRSSITTTMTTTAAATTVTAASSSAASIVTQHRPIRQSRKRSLDEFAEGIDDEDDKEAMQPLVPDRCSTGILGGQMSPTKRRNPSDTSEEPNESRTTTSGRVVKSPRGRLASQGTNNGSEKNILTTMLQAHLARNANLSKASLAPMGASVSDDIALLNKLSSVGSLQLAKLDQFEINMDVDRGGTKQIESETDVLCQETPVVEKAEGSSQKRKQPQTKEVKTGSETKVGVQSHPPESSRLVEAKLSSLESQEEGSGDKPAPKEKRKNSKLLAEIQTCFGSEGAEDNKDSVEKKVSTREQRKIEAAERRFEKIEKNSSKVTSKAPPSAVNQKQIKTRSGQQEDKTMKADDAGQKSSPRSVPKSTGVKNTVRPHKIEDIRTTTRQPTDKQTTPEAKKSPNVAVTPSRMTRSSKK